MIVRLVSPRDRLIIDYSHAPIDGISERNQISINFLTTISKMRYASIISAAIDQQDIYYEGISRFSAKEFRYLLSENPNVFVKESDYEASGAKSLSLVDELKVADLSPEQRTKIALHVFSDPCFDAKLITEYGSIPLSALTEFYQVTGSRPTRDNELLGFPNFTSEYGSDFPSYLADILEFTQKHLAADSLSANGVGYSPDADGLNSMPGTPISLPDKVIQPELETSLASSYQSSLSFVKSVFSFVFDTERYLATAEETLYSISLRNKRAEIDFELAEAKTLVALENLANQAYTSMNYNGWNYGNEPLDSMSQSQIEAVGDAAYKQAVHDARKTSGLSGVLGDAYSDLKGRQAARDKTGGRSSKSSAKPIVLDLDGDGVELIDFSASTAFFDINGDGYRNLMGWVGADDGFLALDKQGDGVIDDIEFRSLAEAGYSYPAAA